MEKSRSLAQQGYEFKAQYDAILAAAVDAIVVIDRQGLVAEFNPAATRLFGYTRDELIGRNVRLLMPEIYASDHDAFIHRYLETGEARIIGIGREVSGRRKNGECFPMELSVGEIRQEHITGFVGLIRDISARKIMDEKIRRQEQELRLTFEQAPVAIATTNLAGRFVTANPAFCRLLEYGESELAQMNWSEISHPDDAASSALYRSQVVQGVIDRFHISSRCFAKGRRMIHAELYNGLVRDGVGKPLFIVVHVVDRTGQVEAELEAEVHRERLAHAARLGTLGELATGIAHEINQPLAAVSSYAEAARRLVQADNDDREMIVDALSKISTQASRAGQVIERMRHFIRRRNTESGTLDCNEVIADVTSLAELDARRHHLTLRLTLTDEPLLISGDAIQLQQVLLNLVRNAVDAMADCADDGVVEISTLRRGNDWVEIRVDDRGGGIPDAIAAQLFEPFVSSKPDGLGLGLSISKSIVEAHGGELRYNARDGGGSRFILVLPVANE